jgi:hypothetical protein
VGQSNGVRVELYDERGRKINGLGRPRIYGHLGTQGDAKQGQWNLKVLNRNELKRFKMISRMV